MPRLAASMDVGGVSGREQRDHRAGRFVDDLRDQLERVLGAQPQPDQRHVGMLPRRHRTDLSDLDLPGDHLMAESGDDLSEQFEPVPPLVRDQDTQVGDLLGGHRPLQRHDCSSVEVLEALASSHHGGAEPAAVEEGRFHP